MDRTDPRPEGRELEQLGDFLDYQRATLLLKAADLDDAQLARTLPPSTLTLGGLLRHATLNEDWWFAVRFAGQEPSEPWASADFDTDPDWEFSTAAGIPGDQLRADYAAACARSRDLVSSARPEALSVRASREGFRWNLRWILLHMIEETARHAGHADLLRESVDGLTGE